MTTIPDPPRFEGILRILDAGHYLYTEPHPDDGEAEFIIHPTNGTVEVVTAGAPMVPWQVLLHVAYAARSRAGQ